MLKALLQVMTHSGQPSARAAGCADATCSSAHRLVIGAALAALMLLVPSCGGEAPSGNTNPPPAPIGLSGDYTWVPARDGKARYRISIRNGRITAFAPLSETARQFDARQAAYVTDDGDFPLLQYTEKGDARGDWLHQIRFDLGGRMPSAAVLNAECIEGHWVTRRVGPWTDDYPTPDQVHRGRLCRGAVEAVTKK